MGRQSAARLHAGRQHDACYPARFPVEQPHWPLQVQHGFGTFLSILIMT